MISICNAQIKSTSFGYEDHGILTCYLHVAGDGWGCGFGGYVLDVYDSQAKQRIGSAYGLQFLIDVMKAVGAASWEKLPGTFVRVETEGLGGGILRIGHITKETWFDPKALKGMR